MADPTSENVADNRKEIAGLEHQKAEGLEIDDAFDLGESTEAFLVWEIVLKDSADAVAVNMLDGSSSVIVCAAISAADQLPSYCLRRVGATAKAD